MRRGRWIAVNAAALVVILWISLMDTRLSIHTNFLTSSHQRQKEAIEEELSFGRPDCLVVFHIPKTGGTSLGNFLWRAEQHLGWTYHTWYHHASTHENQPPILRSAHHTIHAGHYTHQFLPLTHTEHCYKVTILRKPVDRVISAFYYYRHNTSEWEQCLLHPHTDYWNGCNNSYHYHNDMVRLLSGHTETWDSYEVAKYARLVPNESSLQASQDFLKSLELVCFLHNLKACFQTLSEVFNVPIKADTTPRRNVNDKRTEHKVTSSIVQRIQEENALDIRLYKWATEYFGVDPYA
jgi:Sulfotransferase family